MTRTLIPYGRQAVGPDDIRAVSAVLKSDWLTQGPMVRRFEEAFARYCGASYAIAVSSGTAALHLAGLAAGWEGGDEVVTTPLTFAATANAALYAGAEVVFADVERDTLCLDPGQARRKLNRRTKGVITVDFAGMPCLIGRELFPKKNFMVVEDACHALGARARYDGVWKKVGSCEESDMAIFSFHPVKHITTGEGGIVTTKSKTLYDRLFSLRSHGIERRDRRFFRRNEMGNPWYYEVQELGFNYRITDIQCALGLSQLKKLDAFVRTRQMIAAYYDRSFSVVAELRTPARIEGRESSYHLYVLRIDFKKIGKTRREFMEQLRRRGIGTQVHYIPLTRQPYYEQRLRRNGESFPETEAYYTSALSIPIFPGLKKSEMQKVVREIKKLCLKD